MNNSKKSHNLVRQNEKNVKKSQKHDVNLRKNSTLYFQVGLILCLLASYTALEMTFKASSDYVYSTPEPIDNTLYEIVPENFKVEEKEVEKLPEVKRQAPKDPQYQAVDNDKEEEKFIEKIIQKTTDKPIKVDPELNPDDLVVDEPEPLETIMSVQKMPIYPGCEKKKTNAALRKCMSDKLGKLVRKKFDTDLGGELGLSGLQKIDIFFKINKQGEVEILRTRAPHPALDKEAKRIVGKIPTIKPGKNNDKPVEVSYNLPIRFNVQN